MEPTAGAEQSPGENRSTGELVKQVSEQVTVLIRDELKLAQLEMTHKGKQAGVGAGLLGSSGLVAPYGVGCLIACAVIAISGVAGGADRGRCAAGRRRDSRSDREGPPAEGHASGPRADRGRQGKGAAMTTSGPARKPAGRRSAGSRTSTRTGRAPGNPPEDVTPQTTAPNGAEGRRLMTFRNCSRRSSRPASNPVTQSSSWSPRRT